MVEKKSNPFGWFAHGPFGPWGRKLGFRWAFPIGTLAVPFHPLFLPAALLGILGWTAWSVWQAIAGAGGLENSIMMLILALGLGLLMSIPVLCWFVFALGGRLVQSVLFLAAMILIAVDCWQGQISIIWVILPGAYVGLFAVQLLLGPVWLRRIEREAANFAPQDQGQDPVALARFNHSARDLVAACAIPSLFCPPLKGTIKAKHYHWLTEDDARDLTEAMGEGQVPGWKFEPRDGAVLLVREDAAPPRSAILLQEGKLRTPLWLVIGLSRIEAKGCGRHWRLTYGDAMTVQPIPLMNLFRFTSISGSHYNQLVAGFPRRKAATLAKPEVANTREFTLLFPLREGDAEAFDKAGLPALHAAIAEHKRKRMNERELAIANVPAFWQALASGKMLLLLDRESVQVLRDEPERLSADQAIPVLDWLERARDQRDPAQLLGAARLLHAFPDYLLTPHCERLEKLFNSESLALQWEIHKVVDRKPLPRNLPLLAGTYGGFGLFLSCPSLYAKLAGVSPRLANIESLLQRRLASGEAGLCTVPKMIVSRGGVFATGPLDPL
jgi:hypothetical protein